MSVMGKMPAAGPKSLGSASATVNRNHHAMLLPMCAQSLHGYLQWSALAPICRLNQNATRLPALQLVLLRLHLYLSHHVTSNPVQKEAWQSHNGLTKTKKTCCQHLFPKHILKKRHCGQPVKKNLQVFHQISSAERRYEAHRWCGRATSWQRSSLHPQHDASESKRWMLQT